MAIAFEELEGSPVVTITPQGTTAVRTFRVAWSDWQDFAHLLVGRYRAVSCSFVFVRPMEFPEMPNLVVSDLKVEPFDPQNPDGSDVTTITRGTNTYPDAGAKVTATYKTLFDADNQSRADLPGVPTGTYLTYTAELGAEYQTIPGRIWNWVGAAGNPQLPPDINPGLLIPTGTYRLKWHRVALPPWGTIRALRGKVNNGAFGGAAAGTVLFVGARVSRQFQFSDDDGFWQVEYLFSEKTVELSGGTKVGWNYQYKEKAVSGEHWVKVEDDDGNSPYQEAALSTLFQFPACV
ncbi:MAG: hypothetical protein IID44_27715 [Planctomycetes bacterium]|nr:hypothetical protein [Planctomycetota bacterium]